MTIEQSRKEELEEKIADLESSLSALKERLRAEEEREQHELIDNLDTYLEQVDNKYENMRNFWFLMVDELREWFLNNDKNAAKKDES